MPNGGKPPIVPYWQWYGGLPPFGFRAVVPGGGHWVVNPVVGGSQNEYDWPLGRYGFPASAFGSVAGALKINFGWPVVTCIGGPEGES